MPANAAARFDVDFLPGEHGLAATRAAWHAWQAQDADALLYEDWRFAAFRLRSLPPNFDAGVAALRDAHGPAAVVPFRFQRCIAGIPTRILHTIGHGAHRADVDVRAVLAAVGEAAMRRPRVHHVELELPAGPAPGVRAARGFAGPAVQPATPKPGTMLLGPDWDAFLAGQSRKFRKNVRQDLRRMERGGWAAELWRGDAQPGIDLVDDLHDRWLNHRHWNAYRGLHRSVVRGAPLAEAFGGQGLETWVLRRGDEVASALYGVRYRDGFYLLRQGNEPSLLAMSPSVTLRAALIRQLVGQGVRRFEAVGGTEGHWRTEPPERVWATWSRAGVLPKLERGLADALLARKRSPAVAWARRRIARVAPRLAAHST